MVATERLNLDYESRVVSLIAAMHLRAIIKLLRNPDRIVDHLLAEALDLEPLEYTGDLRLARDWVDGLGTDLILGDPVVVGTGLFGITAQIANQPYPVWFAAENPAIPVCFAGLNRYIEMAITGLDLNNPGIGLTVRIQPARFLTLKDSPEWAVSLV